MIWRGPLSAYSLTIRCCQAAPLRALRLAFFRRECNFEADELIIDLRMTKLRLL